MWGCRVITRLLQEGQEGSAVGEKGVDVQASHHGQRRVRVKAVEQNYHLVVAGPHLSYSKLAETTMIRQRWH